MAFFYHADRGRLLSENTVPTSDDRGLSRFGQMYHWVCDENAFVQDAAAREHWAEMVRRDYPEFSDIPSRLHSLFAAPDIAGAERWAREITPVITGIVPIFEVTADVTAVLDSNWLTYDAKKASVREEYNYRYWTGEQTNHRPAYGVRKEPNLEVLLKLPVRVGRKVADVKI